MASRSACGVPRCARALPLFTWAAASAGLIRAAGRMDSAMSTACSPSEQPKVATFPESVTDPRRLRTLCRLAGLAPHPGLAAALEDAPGPAERHRAGVAFAARLARAALDAGAPGLHLYTFNEHGAALDLLEHVDLPRVPHVPVALEDLLLPA